MNADIIGTNAAYVIGELIKRGLSPEQIIAVCRSAADIQLNTFVVQQHIASLMRSFTQNLKPPGKKQEDETVH